MIICRCEEVEMDTIIETLRSYSCTPRELKLRTRAGMGVCGGRTCRNLIQTLYSEVTQKHVSHSVPLKYQPPVRPLTFRELEGKK
ncbi:(2Fe-2S)-binding protein [Desmospora profundinema]|nr:(2Fe-2S)-binding protein [Desmospora profundinema]